MGNSIVRSLIAALLFAGLAATIQAQTITTFAGGGPDNVPATAAAIGTPWGVVQDSNKNTYFSDNLSNRVFKVDSTGKITVLAGNIVPGRISAVNDGVPATTGEMNSPTAIALDAAGNVYVADAGNSVVRVIVTQSTSLTLAGQQIPSGEIRAIAGNGTAGFSGDGGPAISASLNTPEGVWLDSNGNVYIADTVNSAVRVVNTQNSGNLSFYNGAVTVAPGQIATIAGTPNLGGGFNGDGPAISSQLNRPDGVFLDSKGNIYIADTFNSRIRVVNTQSTQITVAGVNIAAYNIGTIAGTGTIGYTGDNGPATQAEISNPSAVFVDGNGNIFFADGDGENPNTATNNAIREVSSSGTISTFAGTQGKQCFYNLPSCGDGGPATSASLWAPTGVFVDGSGNVFISDQNDDAIREVSAGTGIINTVMGIILNTSYSGDANPPSVAGTATDASLRRPAGVATDASGNVFISDTLNNTVREVTTGGVITTVAGNGTPCSQLICGEGQPATKVSISTPAQAVFGPSGNLYIAVSGDNAIRMVNQAQPPTISTVAGTGRTCSMALLPCGDGVVGSATSGTALNSPSGLFIDNSGNIYIADTNDNAIRVVNTQTQPITVAGVTIQPSTIETVAGTLDPNKNGDCPGGTGNICGDGGPATAATLNLPSGVALDSAGNIYIADTGDNRVRVVNAKSGVITTFAGTGAACQTSCGDGGPATAAILDAPQGLYIDFAGNVFIADTFDYEIREVTPDGTINAVVDMPQERGYAGDNGPASAALLALPFGIGGDPFGNLFIADAQEWRIRKVTQTVSTPPRADVSPANVQFADQSVGSTSAAMTVTLTNSGFGTSLKVSSVEVSGTDASDFAVSNKCGSSVAAGATCDIDVTFSPTATGSRSATLTITDNAVQGSQQTVALSGKAVVGFTMPSSGTLTSPSLSPGGQTTATVTITPQGNFTGQIDLTCSVSPSPSLAPTCSLNPTQVTPKGNAAVSSTLTVMTTAATSGALTQPGIQHHSMPVYAIWLVLPAMLLGGAGLSARDRKKLIGYMLLCLLLTGIVFMVACGGGSSNSGNGGGGGSAGTPAGAYTITVTAKSGSTVSTQTFPLNVQ